MKKIKYILLTIVLIIFIININIVISSTKDALILFINKIFISIFPFIILSDILLYYDYHLFINKLFGNIISKLFNIDKNSTIIFILSILTSHPANAIYIKNMLDKNEIDIKSANKLLCFTYFPSISFVFGLIGITYYKSLKTGLILWLFILINNILIGLYLRKEKTISNIKIQIKKEDFITTIKSSIQKGINTSIIILGNLIIFTIITNILKYYLNNYTILNIIISNILEMSNGINQTFNSNLNINIKLTLTLFSLLFSGLSIIFQSISILNDYKINIKRILIIKLVFSIITSFVFYLLI